MKKIYSISLVLSAILFMELSSVAQYCTPIINTSFWGGGEVRSVNTTGGIQNISNTTGNSAGYFDFTKSSPKLIVKPGDQIKLIVGYDYGLGVWVDWDNKNGWLNSPPEQIYVDGGFGGGSSPRTINMTVPTTAVRGVDLRMRVVNVRPRNLSPCVNSTWNFGDVEDYSVFITFDNNAGIKKIAAPAAECKGSAGTAVDVLFTNTGVKNLDTLYFAGKITTKLNITTKIDTVMWAGSLKSGETVKTPFNVFNNKFNFLAGDTVCVWSFNPNNVPDSASADDTLCYVVLKGMEGTFTVGDTTSGMHDFRTLKDAIDSLNEAGAICDSVVFELHDTTWSSYKGQYQIKDIIGTSPSSPIIIRPEAHNTNLTRVWFDSCSEDFNHVFLLENVSDIFFEDLNISATDGKGTGFARVFNIVNSDRVNIINCSIKNSQFTRTDSDFDLVVADGGDDLMISGSNFTAGSSSLVISGYTGVKVSDNKFSTMYNRGIDISGSNDILVNKNSFVSKSFLLSGGRAISLDNVNNSVEISYNTVMASNGQWPQYGVYMDKCNALNSSSKIYNNMINLGQSWSSITFHGIHMSDVVGTSVLFNSVAVSGNSTNNASLYSNGGTRNVAFNNVFAVPISGFSIDIPVSGSVVSGNYNNLYSGGGTVGRLSGNANSSLSAWQSATGLDANSLTVNPFFYKISKNDLHVCNDKLFQAGTPIIGVMDDWDGDARDPKKPCIGADEFAPVSQFSLGSSYGLCDGDTTNLVAGKGLTGEIAIWKNGAGSIIDTSQTISITTPGKYSVTLLNACGINADSIEIIAPVKVILSNDTNMCPNFTLNVDATTTNGNKYLWSNGQTSPTISVTQEGTYHVTATDKWNCLSSDSLVVTYSNAATLSVGDTIVCPGKDFLVFGGISKLQPNVSYKWFGFDIDPGDVDNVFIDHGLMSRDTTIVVQLTHRGCVTVDSMKVERKPLPSVKNIGFYTNGLGLYINSNKSTGKGHNWNFDDNDSSSWATPRHLYKKPGTYNVKYTNSNICGSVDTTMEVIIIVLGLGENNANSKLNVYPNPNNGDFNIELTDINAKSVSVKIMDAQGRTVYSKELGQVAGSAKELVSLNGTGAGIYLIQLNIDGVTQIARITIE